jgi:hypothetical protein
VFPAVDLARRAGEAGGCLTAVYNAANEEAAAAFLAGPDPASRRSCARSLTSCSAADQWTRANRLPWKTYWTPSDGPGKRARDGFSVPLRRRSL